MTNVSEIKKKVVLVEEDPDSTHYDLMKYKTLSRFFFISRLGRKLEFPFINHIES